MKAIILAAGQGNRLKPLTDNYPKCMVPINGKPIIEHLIETFYKCNIPDITIVTGYKDQVLKKYLDKWTLNYVHNYEYKTTNMLYSLFCALKDIDKDDIIISYSDIVYSTSVLQSLIKSTNNISVIIDTLWQELWDIRMDNIIEDVETLKINKDDTIREIGRKPKSLDQVQGQYIGLLKFKKSSLNIINNIYENLCINNKINKELENLYLTDYLQYMIDESIPIHAEYIKGKWLEVDSCDDLNRYNQALDKNTVRIKEVFKF